MLARRARSTSRTATATSSTGAPSCVTSNSGRSRNTRTTAPPTVPAPRTATLSGLAGAISGSRAARTSRAMVADARSVNGSKHGSAGATAPADRSMPLVPGRSSAGGGSPFGFRGFAGYLSHLRSLAADLIPDADVPRFANVEAADDQRHRGDDDRVDQPGIQVSGGRQDGTGDERQEPAEPAVADVIRDGQACIAGPSWEELD